MAKSFMDNLEWYHVVGAIVVIFLLANMAQPQAAFFDTLDTARYVCEYHHEGGGTIYTCVGTCPNDNQYCANFNDDEIQDSCLEYGDYEFFENCGDGSYIRTCVDSDGGKTYGTKGIVTWEAGEQSGTKTDKCQDSSMLIEYYCTADYDYADEFHACDCQDGKCVSGNGNGGNGEPQCNPDVKYVYLDNEAEFTKYYSNPMDGKSEIGKLIRDAYAPERVIEVHFITDLNACCEPVQLSFTQDQQEYDCGTLCTHTYQLNGYTYKCKGSTMDFGDFCHLFEFLKPALPDSMKNMYCMFGILLIFMMLLIFARLFGG